jgi:hypothetical protein
MSERIYLGGFDTPPPGEEVCDFCGEKGTVKWAFPCRTEFEIGKPEIFAGVALHIDNTGWWAACDECCKIIKRADREALANRGVDLHLQRHPVSRAIPRPFLIQTIKEAHDSFWANRDGADPITAEEYRRRFLDKVPGHEGKGDATS